MSNLVLQRTGDSQIRTLATDIHLTQQQQIGQMYAWLELWSLPQSSSPTGLLGHRTECSTLGGGRSAARSAMLTSLRGGSYKCAFADGTLCNRPGQARGPATSRGAGPGSRTVGVDKFREHLRHSFVIRCHQLRCGSDLQSRRAPSPLPLSKQSDHPTRKGAPAQAADTVVGLTEPRSATPGRTRWHRRRSRGPG